MKLINAETLVLKEFLDVQPETLKYAILSHTWEDEEVTFQDFTGSDRHLYRFKGFRKIAATCKLALRDSIPYVWVDTCCIDKTSSAELTEAINSMFKWYRNAKVCYAWLADLPVATEVPIEQSLRNCRWFTRGWTLQELLAPRHVEFYDRDWGFRGTKSDLKELIAEASGIGIDVLENPEGLHRFPVAQRMSWAANRQTTRLEDMAYCLIGIFGVNMPMLYGEGERAFLRLQEEIAKETNDLSIFAWKAIPNDQKYHGIFARSPAEFRDCGDVELIDSTAYSPEYSVTNKGVRITADVPSGPDRDHFLKLNCATRFGQYPIGIYIHHHGGDVYSRVIANNYYWNTSPVGGPSDYQKTSIYILKQLDALRSRDLETSHRHAFVFRQNFNTALSVSAEDFPFFASPISPKGSWYQTGYMLHTQGIDQFNGFAYFSPAMQGNDLVGKLQMAGEWFMVAFGKCNEELEPWIVIRGKEDAEGLPWREPGRWDFVNMKMDARRSFGRPQSVLLRDFEERPLVKVIAKLVEGMLDEQTVYFIDLELEDIQHPSDEEDNMYIGDMYEDSGDEVRGTRRWRYIRRNG